MGEAIPRDYCVQADLDGIPPEEVVVLSDFKSEIPEGRICIFHQTKKGLKKLWESRLIPAWKIWVADVNHDKRNDLIIALKKYEAVDQQIKNRLYVYGWNGENIFPIWKGTSLSRPYVDLTFADVNNDGKTELISLEKSQLTKNKDKTFITTYRWNGFGFTGIDQIILQGDYHKIGVSGDKVKVCDKSGNEYILERSNDI